MIHSNQAKIKMSLVSFLLVTQLAGITSAAMFSNKALADAPAAPAYVEDSAKFNLSDQDYADLRSYMNIARDTLEQTLAESRRLGGFALHQRLLSGIQSALSQSGLKYDLLLFRHILNRAIELDKIFLKSGENPMSYGQTSATVLLSSIRLAIQYYNGVDLPRLTSKTVPSADWIAFAHDNIGVFESMIALAPSERARHEIVERALGWTLSAINSAPNRRTYAREIMLLADMQKYIGLNQRSVAEAQQLLFEVQSTLGQDVKEHQEKAKTETPEAITSPRRWRWNPYRSDATFPLVKSDLGGELTWNSTQDYSERGNHLILGGFHRIQLEGGVGPIAEIETGKPTQAFSQISARAQLLTSYMQNKFAFFSAFGDIRTEYSPGTLPMYHVKMSATVAAAGIFGGWIAFEKNQYQNLEERLLRVGWGASLIENINGTDYVMVRTGLGVNFIDGLLKNSGSPQAFSQGGNNISGEMAAIIKMGSFLLNVESNLDKVEKVSPTGGDNAFRLSTQAAITIPLNAIFGNDGIKFDAEIQQYLFDDPRFKDMTVFKTGVSYVLRW